VKSQFRPEITCQIGRNFGLTAHGNKTLHWARKTVSHLSIIVILTPHREHFSARLKFTAADKN
jgi:hypothetical protein